MGKNNSTEFVGVKKETVLLFVFISLIIGFVGGVVFSAYKFSPGMLPPQGMPPHAHSGPGAQNLSVLKDAVEKTPRDVSAWVRLANFYFDAAQFENAISAYKSALEIEPENADVLTDLGVMYRRNGDPEAALASFQKAYAIDPNHEISRFNAGVVLMHDLKKPDEAKAVWESLIQRNPSYTTPSGQSVASLLEKMK